MCPCHLLLPSSLVVPLPKSFLHQSLLLSILPTILMSSHLGSSQDLALDLQIHHSEITPRELTSSNREAGESRDSPSVWQVRSQKRRTSELGLNGWTSFHKDHHRKQEQRHGGWDISKTFRDGYQVQCLWNVEGVADVAGNKTKA